ncbi:MAG: hypothetical protein BMS9Abin31_1334 [Gammaproteobacteria bacterium]|nr:MAG: hypothetical protein BMS9Abin31_1334 [Gammaproteobacteria bacterium]
MISLAKKTFSANADTLQDIRASVRQACEKQAATTEQIENIVLAINEACMNIIQHAYENEPDKDIILEIFSSKSDKKKEMIFQLTDHADCIDQLKIKSRDLNDISPGGLGVHMIQELMDHVCYIQTDTESQSKSGNTLELRKIIHP